MGASPRYGLIFDLDGVLADTEAISAQAWIQAFRQLYNLHLTPDDFTAYIGTGADNVIRGIAKKTNTIIDEEKTATAALNNFQRLLNNTSTTLAFPGVHDLLSQAADHPHWSLALATSSPKSKALATLQKAQIDAKNFDALITGDAVTQRKPHPEIYLKAAQTIAIPPKNCLVIEDAITGIQAAKAAGMTSIAITNSFPKEKLQHADHVLTSIDQINIQNLPTYLAP